MSKGRHAKPNENTSTMKKVALATTVGLGAVVVPATFANSASAATVEQWDKIAYCESTGNWSASGYYSGGLQIGDATWADYGGTEYAPRAGQATKKQQIMIAEKILAGQGAGAWAVLTANTGNTSQGSCQGLISSSDSYLKGGPNPYPSGSTPSTPTAPTAPTAPSTGTGSTKSADKAIQWALAKVDAGNLYYVWGGEGPTGYDCSGFLQAAWKAAGINIPRDTYGMDAGLPHVNQSQMRPGDLILWNFQGAGASPNHVTMYIGDGQMVEMSGSRGNVVGNVAGRGGAIVGVVRPAASETPSVPSTPTTPTTPPPADPGDDTPTTPPPSTDPGGSGGYPEGGKHYTVKAGDYLVKIADEQDVRGGWKALYEANKEAIGSNPNVIHVGQDLILPNPDAYDMSGLPEPDSKSPSAVPLQKELKRGGYLADSVKENANYGPLTQAAVAKFHNAHTEFRSTGVSHDVRIGPKGWAFLLGADDATPAPAPAEPSPTPTPSEPTPEPTTPAPSADFVKPVDASLGTAYHQSGSAWSLGYHTGVDFPAPIGTPVKAIAAGTVVTATDNSGSYGTHVQIKHADGKYSFYAHFSSRAVSVGDTVTAGEVIGAVGVTGNTSGPHLHFEVRTSPEFGADVDPIAYLEAHGVNF